jgi:hypothetical protein
MRPSLRYNPQQKEPQGNGAAVKPQKDAGKNSILPSLLHVAVMLIATRLYEYGNKITSEQQSYYYNYRTELYKLCAACLLYF